MGTNYYYYKRPPCTECGRPFNESRIHIGKNSYGWRFALHIYPEDPEKPQSLDDWKVLFNVENSEIRNEYGKLIPKARLLTLIENKETPSSMDELRYHGIDRFCIGHGSGTYDLVIGDFT